eukprot:scaffold1129_cov302-Pinguiococcus_pyrenoidosus.AAC.2
MTARPGRRREFHLQHAMLAHRSSPRLAKRAHRVHFAEGFRVARFGCPPQLLVPGQSAVL